VKLTYFNDYKIKDEAVSSLFKKRGQEGFYVFRKSPYPLFQRGAKTRYPALKI
jgi:hypothetical protein